MSVITTTTTTFATLRLLLLYALFNSTFNVLFFSSCVPCRSLLNRSGSFGSFAAAPFAFRCLPSILLVRLFFCHYLPFTTLVTTVTYLLPFVLLNLLSFALSCSFFLVHLLDVPTCNLIAARFATYSSTCHCRLPTLLTFAIVAFTTFCPFAYLCLVFFCLVLCCSHYVVPLLLLHCHRCYLHCWIFHTIFYLRYIPVHYLYIILVVFDIVIIIHLWCVYWPVDTLQWYCNCCIIPVVIHSIPIDVYYYYSLSLFDNSIDYCYSDHSCCYSMMVIITDDMMLCCCYSVFVVVLLFHWYGGIPVYYTDRYCHYSSLCRGGDPLVLTLLCLPDPTGTTVHYYPQIDIVVVDLTLTSFVLPVQCIVVVVTRLVRYLLPTTYIVVVVVVLPVLVRALCWTLCHCAAIRYSHPTDS